MKLLIYVFKYIQLMKKNLTFLQKEESLFRGSTLKDGLGISHGLMLGFPVMKCVKAKVLTLSNNSV